MKWIITADVHLDHNPDHAYRWRTMDLVRMRMQDQRADGLIVLGDLVDAKDRHPAKFVHQVAALVREIAQFGPVWILKGNHDYVDPACPFFGWLNEFEGVQYISEPETRYNGNALFVPHGVSWEGNAGWRREFPLTGRKVIFAHETFNGCKASNGSKLQGVPLATVSRKVTGGAPVIAGDIHVPQQIGNVTYVGSPHACRFGDTYEPRMLQWNSEANTFTAIEFPGIRRAVVDFKQNSGGWIVTPEVPRRGDHVKARYRGVQADLPQWPEIRERIRTFIEKLGARSFGEEFHIEAPELDAEALELDTRDDAQVFDDVCKSQGVAPELVEASTRWLDTVEAPEAPQRPDLRLDSIAIRGFRAFVDDVAFKFPSEAGVYLLTGKNGSGKTSFFQALYWLLYGRLTTGLVAKQVANWGRETETSVVLDCYINGRLTTVTRRWNPVALTVERALAEPEKVSQAEVDRMIGFDRKRFLGVVYFPQGSERFVRQTPAAQLASVSELLGLERWQKRIEAARATKRELERKIERLDREQIRVSTKLEEREAEWRRERGKAIAFHQGLERIRFDKRVDILWRRVMELDKQAQSEQQKRRDDLEVARSVVSDWLAEMHDSKAALDDESCEECGAALEPLTGDERAQAEAAVAEAEKQWKAAQRARDAAKKRLDNANEARKLTKASLDELRDYEAGTNPAIDEELAAIDIRDEIVNTHAKRRGELDLEIHVLRDELEAQAKERTQVEGEVEVAKHAEQLFRRTLVALLESAAREFETYANSNLPQLGLDRWSFRCRTTNDEGELVWQILVQAPQAPDWVDMRAWSGGELTRLCVAGEAAFSDLARARLGMRIPFEFWDEPTEYLEGEGLHDIMSFFRWRATSLEKQVWIIDHRTQHAGEVDRYWRVEKTSRGTTIKPA